SGLRDGSKGRESRSFIRLHELGVANDIGRHDGGEAMLGFGARAHQGTLKTAKTAVEAILSHPGNRRERKLLWYLQEIEARSRSRYRFPRRCRLDLGEL